MGIFSRRKTLVRAPLTVADDTTVRMPKKLIPCPICDKIGTLRMTSNGGFFCMHCRWGADAEHKQAG